MLALYIMVVGVAACASRAAFCVAELPRNGSYSGDGKSMQTSPLAAIAISQRPSERGRARAA